MMPREMTAIAPVGGSGKRLYPLTLETPKPLVPIANKHIFQAAAEKWAYQGVTRFILAAIGYRNRVELYRFFKQGEGFSRRINLPNDVEFLYSNYEDNIGNAGAFVWSLDTYRSILRDSDILLINGDNLSDIDLGEFYEAHKQKKAVLTVAVKGLEREDPRLPGYGTALFDEKTLKVERFVEKSRTPLSRYANTGICLVSPAIFDLEKDIRQLMDDKTKDGGEFDIGGHLITFLVDYGTDVYAYPFSGAWSDVGTPQSFSDTTKDILYGHYLNNVYNDYTDIRTDGSALVHKSTRQLMGDKLDDVEFRGRCVVGSNVHIDPGTVLQDSVLCDNSYVGSDVHISGVTTVMPFARIGHGVRLSNCIIGHDTTVGDRSDIKSGSVIGDDLRIPPETTVGVDWRVARHEYTKEIKSAKMYRIVENEGSGFGAVVFTE